MFYSEGLLTIKQVYNLYISRKTRKPDNTNSENKKNYTRVYF